MRCHLPRIPKLQEKLRSTLCKRNNNHFPRFPFILLLSKLVGQRKCSAQHPLAAPSLYTLKIQSSLQHLPILLLHILLEGVPPVNFCRATQPTWILILGTTANSHKGLKNSKSFCHLSILITLCLLASIICNLYDMKKRTLLIYVGYSESNAPYLFARKVQQTQRT